MLYLKPGDILLYRPAGIFGRLIQVKTWHSISHVEIYDGGKQSLASRDGIGVGRYETRLKQLAFVLRPRVRLDLQHSRSYFSMVEGRPYGWLDLLNFIGLPIKTRGMFCSEFAVEYLRAAGWDIFPEDDADRVSPFQFLDLLGPELGLAYTLDKTGALTSNSLAA